MHECMHMHMHICICIYRVRLEREQSAVAELLSILDDFTKVSRLLSQPLPLPLP